MLYAAVFLTRYLDLFRAVGWNSFYLVFFKLFYIISSFYIILLMMKVYPRTREREKAWKLALWSLGGSIVLAPILPAFYKEGYPYHWITEVSRKTSDIDSLQPHANETAIPLDCLDLFHCSRVSLCTSTAFAPATDHCSHCD